MKDKLIDTSVFVDFLRGKTEAKVWFNALEVRHVAVSAVSVMELVQGCRNKAELDEVNQLLARYTVHHFSNAISQRALDWYKQFHLSHRIGYLDCLIAATAIEHELQVCTWNVKHFVVLLGVDADKPY